MNVTDIVILIALALGAIGGFKSGRQQTLLVYLLSLFCHFI